MSLKDKILGREGLKRRIKTLEQKIENLDERRKELKRSADEERKRAKEAITEKQEVDKELNRARDKIKSLEGQLKANKQVEEISGTTDRKKVSRKRLEKIIEKLGSVEGSGEDLYSIYLKPESSISLGESEDLELNMLRRVNNVESETGKILFADVEGIVEVLIKPPLIVRDEAWEMDSRFDLYHLEEMLKNSKFGLIFLSSGGSTLARIGDDVEEFERVKSEIKGQHSKGGFSQGRFERKRDGAVEKHLDEVQEKVGEFFGRDTDCLMISGVHRLVKKFREDLKIDIPTFEKKLDFSTIDSEEELENNIEELWKCEIIKI